MPPEFFRDRKELELFLFFFLVFALFMNWGGVNSWARYDLAAATVEEGSFDISRYSYNTLDKSLPGEEFLRRVEERTRGDLNRTGRLEVMKQVYREMLENSSLPIYSNKAPMSSFLAAPGYLAGDSLAGPVEGESTWWRNGLASWPVELDRGTALKQFFILLTVPVLAGSGLMVMIYRYLRDELDDRTALLTVLVAGLATPLFTYSATFFGVASAAFLSFTSFLALERSTSGGGERWMYVAGALSALAVSTVYYAAIVPAALVLYLLVGRESRSVARFSAGVLMGALPLFFYHWTTTGNPFLPVVLSYRVFPLFLCATYSCAGRVFGGFILDPVRVLNAAFRLLFLESRGLFFYSPILLLSIPGIHELYMRKRKLLLLSPGIPLLLLLFQATYVNWLAGLSFGPRYVIVGLPFLALPLALGIRKMVDQGKAYQVIVLLVFLFSAFNMLVAFNDLPSLQMSQDEYTQRFSSMEPVQPGFYDGLLDRFSKFGPRSELLMSLVDRSKGLDLTYMPPYGPSHLELATFQDQGVLLSTNLIPLMLLIALFSAFFWREFRWLEYLGPAAVLLLFLGSLSLSNAYVLDDFYRSGDSVVPSSGEFEAVVYTDEDEMPMITLREITPANSTRLNATLEDETYRYIMRSEDRLYFPEAEEGRNSISFSSRCIVPALWGDYDDTRCISVSVQNLSSVPEGKIEDPLLVRGWYELGELENGSWLAGKGEVWYRSGEEHLLSLNLTEIPYGQEYSLEIEVNGEQETTVSPLVYPVRMAVEPSGRENFLSLEPEGCVVPAEVSDSRDTRCLSFRLQDFTVETARELDRLEFGSGWYRESSLAGRSVRWMGSSSRMFYDSTGRELLKVVAEPYKNLGGGMMAVKLNGERVEMLNFTRSDSGLVLLEPDEGISSLTLKSPSGCRVPRRIEPGSEDGRCLSFRIDEISVDSGEEIEGIKLGKGWYRENRLADQTFRWMESDSEFFFSGRKPRSLSLEAEPYKQLESKVMEVFINGRKTAELDFNRSGTASTVLVPGRELNSVRLESRQGCMTPARVEMDSDDDRCLSFRISNLSLEAVEKKSFTEGWYQWEQGEKRRFRWMRGEAGVEFPARGGLQLISFGMRRHVDVEGGLEVVVKGETVETFYNDTLRKDLVIDTERGLNSLRFVSEEGCVVPAEVSDSRDRRCLSFRLEELDIRSLERYFRENPKTFLDVRGRLGIFEQGNRLVYGSEVEQKYDRGWRSWIQARSKR